MDEILECKPIIKDYVLTSEMIQEINCYKHLKFSIVQELDSFKIKAKVIGLEFCELTPKMIAIKSTDTIEVVSDDYILAPVCEGLFQYTKFKSIDMHNLDTSQATNMNEMFKGSKAKYIDLSTLKTSNVWCMGHMFNGCEVTSIDVSNFDTSNVTWMGFMFEKVNNVIGVDRFDTTKVQTMRGMFNRYTGTVLDLSNFRVDSLRDTSFMFSDCNIEKLILMDLKLVEQGTLTGDSMFYYSKIKQLYGNGIETVIFKSANSIYYKTEIEEEM